MKKKVLYSKLLGLFFVAFLFMLYHSGIANAQYYNQAPEYLKANGVWAFGDRVGLNFNSGGPVKITTDTLGNEGFASVADPETGELLFYTNGKKCWNKNNQVMPDGTGLFGNGQMTPNTSFQMITTTQGALIVPVIDSPGRYYLFSLFGMTSGQNPSQGSLFYSIVDMNLDNGLGNIDTNFKNVVLSKDLLSEGMIAIPGNHCDIWLMLHGYRHLEFRAYHITNAGIDTVPVVSNWGGTYNGILPSPFFINTGNGALSVSPDRKKVVFSGPADQWEQIMDCSVVLGDFDINTGAVNNIKHLACGSENVYTTCFSPDNTKLYACHRNNIYQYDLSRNDTQYINQSKTHIKTITPEVSYLRLYNDTIYASDVIVVNIDTIFCTLSRINQPNNSGLSCDFQSHVVQFPGTAQGYELWVGGVNNYVIPISDTIATRRDSLICFDDRNATFLYVDSSFDRYLWSTGDTTFSSLIDQEGIYWVVYSKGCQKYMDSFVITGSHLFTTVTINVFTLGVTGGPFASYQWYFNGEPIPGATEETYDVTSNGDYTVEVTDDKGCRFISDIYTVNNWGIGIEDQKELSDAISIYPNPTEDLIYINSPISINALLLSVEGREIGQYNNVRKISLNELAKGIYLLYIIDQNGNPVKTEKVIKN